ncbi:MAG: RNA polymerase factor sigma-32 [Rhodospirillales bacterium]|nr:RNA polymerase factor sigma-32 [Rhodospirillales bacterium]
MSTTTHAGSAGGDRSLSVDRGLQRFIRETRKHAFLDAAEEQRLARLSREQGDREATDMLVNSHMRLVIKIAMQYRHYPAPVEDLISEGTLGLIQAVERFDPGRGYRLSTYAMWWIRAAITDFVIRSWSLVKTGTTSEQKKLFFKLRKTKARLHAYEDGELPAPVIRQIAEELAVPESDVVMMNRRLAGPDATLNAPLRDGSDGEWQDWLPDEGDSPYEQFADREEQSVRRRMIRDAMDILNERERDIVGDRHLREDPVTLEQLSRRFGISRERVRQIEVEAIAKIKRFALRQQYLSQTHRSGARRGIEASPAVAA